MVAQGQQIAYIVLESFLSNKDVVEVGRMVRCGIVVRVKAYELSR